MNKGVHNFDGAKLRDLRVANHWDMQTLARKIRVATSAVMRWEIGKNKPHPRRVKQLAKALGVEPDVLLVPEVEQ